MNLNFDTRFRLICFHCITVILFRVRTINLRNYIYIDILTQIRHLKVYTPTLRARSIFARVENYWPRKHFIIFIFASWTRHAIDHKFRIIYHTLGNYAFKNDVAVCSYGPYCYLNIRNNRGFKPRVWAKLNYMFDNLSL